jgi:protein gp37
MGDLFHEDVSDGFIAAVFGVMAASPQHTFQILTKRPKRAKYWFEWIEEVRGGGYTVTPDFRVLDAASQYGVDINLSTEYEWPLPNVWIGATVENQRSADSRIAHLLKIPATIRFISVEPMLYSIDLQEVSLGGTLRGDVLNKVYGPVIGPRPFRRPMENGIDWVICGGESGVNARPTLLRWIRELRDQCISAEVPFMFKQWGEWVNNSQVWVITKNFRKILVENEVMCRVGKANSGKYLDQKLHLEYPKMESK